MTVADAHTENLSPNGNQWLTGLVQQKPTVFLGLVRINQISNKLLGFALGDEGETDKVLKNNLATISHKMGLKGHRIGMAELYGSLMQEAVRMIYYILFNFMYQGQFCNFLIFWNGLCL